MSPQPRATIVVDLGFGDSGKGTVIDFLARQGAEWVVRFNGGAQAGHNVVTPDGRHHTFAQFGSGTFVPGVRTHLSRWMVVHPTALLIEDDYLRRVGVLDAMERLTISDQALVITPFHQAANRLRAAARAGGALGTCGVGFGETVGDALRRPLEALRMGDLFDTNRVMPRLERIQASKRGEIEEVIRMVRDQPALAKEIEVLEDRRVVRSWVERISPLRRAGLVVDDRFLGEVLRSERHILFEGAQGVLLDEWRGFHPHTTWSTCTFDNALGLLEEYRFEGEVQRLAVLRSYLTRHGSGPFPTEAPELRLSLPEPHNSSHGWQGTFRVGWPDLVLARYALSCCGGADALALTHLDRVASDWKVCTGYRLLDGVSPVHVGSGDVLAGRVSRLPLGPPHDLEFQSLLTQALSTAVGECVSLSLGSDPQEAYASFLERELELPIGLKSYGPTATAKRLPRQSRKADGHLAA